jgi:YbgC/YbaW family acyl-CoA thioester hydrolase
VRISKPHHTETIRVDLADTDASGSMHFIAGLRYAERAETGLRRRLGILSDWVDYPMRGVEASYDVIPRFDDELEVRLRLESVGRTSLKWVWEIVRGADMCIQGRHTAVHVDSEFRPQPFPPEVRAALESLPGD